MKEYENKLKKYSLTIVEKIDVSRTIHLRCILPEVVFLKNLYNILNYNNLNQLFG